MKMRLLIACVMCMFMSVNAFAQGNNASVKDLLGDWLFKMEGPMGEVDGTCTFSQDGGNTIALMNIGGMIDLTTTPIVHKEGNIFTASVNGEMPADITYTLNGDKIACQLGAGDMIMEMEMTKKK